MTRIFAAPAAIAAVSLFGLVSGLTGDGTADLLCWTALVLPLAATGWAMRTRRG